MKTLLMGMVAVALGSGEAAADYQSNLASAANDIKQTPPRAGVAEAPPASGGRPAWCGPLTEEPNLSGLTGFLERWYTSPRLDHLQGAAEALCRNDTSQPVIKLATREIVQLWMNEYGLSAADVVESIKLSTTNGARDQGSRKTCDALKIDDEVGGADLAYVSAKRTLFGCGNDQFNMTVGGGMPGAVAWLDSSGRPADELLRFAYVHQEAKFIADSFENTAEWAAKRIMDYAVAQFDFKAFDPKLVLAAVDIDPRLKGNAYAKTIIKEKLGRTRLALLAIEQGVKAKTDKDPSWKEILITAPQKAYADHVAATAKYKDQLQRSAEVEQTLFGPSRTAMKGCLTKLKPDLAAILKTMKRDTVNELVSSMNANPVAGLLLRRFQACMAVDGDNDAARELLHLKLPIRVLRGPRAAAYYATLDAIRTVRADRDKFPASVDDISSDRKELLNDLTSSLMPDRGPKWYSSSSEEQGVVKSVKKGKDGLAVVFAKDKQERWNESCTMTNRIVTFDHGGKPIFDRNCKGNVVKVDVSPAPITILDIFADGIAPGRSVSFGVQVSGSERRAMPFAVYKDKKGKGLVAWMTIGL